jgi:FMN phosphatase YigB (HAD superfamily)
MRPAARRTAMAVRAVVFDVGGVLEHAIDTYLDGRWEQRLGLAAGEFLARLRRAGLGQDANLGGSRRQRTCHWLGVRPDELVFLDDIEANLVAAREVGMHAVLFQHTT